MNRLGGLDDDKIKIFQKLARDVFSKYPHAGVTKQPFSK